MKKNFLFDVRLCRVRSKRVVSKKVAPFLLTRAELDDILRICCRDLSGPNDEPVGVLLLTHVPLRPAIELVYVGVVPQARGRSYGRLLVRLAIEAASRARKDHLMLAVDRRNHYALKIYGELGFTETDRRHAWIRSLLKYGA